MGTFGQFLRQQRESRLIPLSVVAEATRINIRFLQALEDEQLEKLPHSTFVKGFLRSYANFLALDGDDLVLNYERLLLSRQEAGVQKAVEKEQKSQEKRFSFVSVFSFFLLFLLLIGIFLVLRFAVGPFFTKTPKENLPLPEQTPKQENTISASRNEQASTTTVMAPEIDSAKKVPAPINKSSFSLEISASEDCWLSVDIDNTRSLDFFLRSGQKKSLSAKKKILFKTIGNAQALTLSYNGKSLSLNKKGVEVIHDFVFSPDTDLNSVE